MMDNSTIAHGAKNAVIACSSQMGGADIIQYLKSEEEKRAEKLRKKALAAAIRRANETPEQTEERRRKNRERQRKTRAEALRKSLALHTGSALLAARKPESITEKGEPGSNNGDNGDQPYICIVCKAIYESPVQFFDHIQQQCLKSYLEQPDVFSKILTFVKSKMKEIHNHSSKEESGGCTERKCSRCEEHFSITAYPQRMSDTLCPTCQRLQQDVKVAGAISPHSSELKYIKCEGEISEASSPGCNAVNTPGKRSANCDLIEGAVPPKRPLLTCEASLPSYLWPNQIPYPLKAVRLFYNKGEPYKRHHCWECDSPILPTSKRFIDHFKMMYECQWCVYTTHCHQASVDHVMRMHASEEVMQSVQENRHNPEDDMKVDQNALLMRHCDDDFVITTIKSEPSDLDEPLFPEMNQNNHDSERVTLSAEDLNEDDSDIVPMPPVNFRCLEITATTLLLQWDPPWEGRVTNYAVLFQGSGAPSQQLLPQEQTLIRLVGLTPDTLYIVRVYTVNGDMFSQYATLFRQTSRLDDSTLAIGVTSV